MDPETKKYAYPGRPELNLPDGYIGLFAGRSADNYGNFYFAHRVVRGVVSRERFGDMADLQVIEPDSTVFPWREVMLDSMFEVKTYVLLPGIIFHDEHEELWEQYIQSPEYRDSLK